MRFYCEQITESIAELTGDEAHHLADVMRAGIGEKVELFDGKGTVAAGTIAHIAKNKIKIDIQKADVF